ncbi:MAG: M48 family metalloprotease, partial [Pseudomonadota bacterium]
MRRLKILRALAAATASAALCCSSAAAQGLLRDAEIEQFLDDYSRPVFKAAGLPADEIKILIVGDQTFNAFAGGLVMGVNSGLITISDTPSQIQGVIAHEAGHIAGGHSTRSDEAMASATRPMLLSLVLAAGAIAAGAPDAGLGLLGLGQTVGIANALKYSRGQESSADQAALTYLQAI